MFCFSVVYENAAILFGCEAPEMWLSISSSGGDDERLVLFGWVTVALRITLSNYDFLNQVWTLKLNLLWPLIHPDFRSVRHNWSFWFTCPWALVDLLHEHEEDRRATGEKKKKKQSHISAVWMPMWIIISQSRHITSAVSGQEHRHFIWRTIWRKGCDKRANKLDDRRQRKRLRG